MHPHLRKVGVWSEPFLRGVTTLMGWSASHRQYYMSNSDARYVRNATFAVGVLFQSQWNVQILFAMRTAPVRLGQLGGIDI
jgi:hypothetical protein